MSNRRLSPFSSLGLICAALIAAPGLRARSSFPPSVYSANNSADYSTTIAQGSLFVVFGADLGPATLTNISSLPLPSVLAGTSVTVTSGSTTLNCPMIYTSEGQVAAILPSTTPIGQAEVTVAYNGQIDPYGYSVAAITVAKTSVGVFTIGSSGLGGGVITDPGGTLKTFSNSAKSGDILIAWATGLGPIGTPDNTLPASFPSFPEVQVWVGGQPALLSYAGRSGCCAAVDQIAFTVPAGVSGCNVPVTVVSSATSSNTVTVPINAGGGACSDTGPTPPTSVLTKAAAGQPVRLGAIGVGPTRILSLAGFGQGFINPEAVARRLSAALGKDVPEADAARIVRAFASHNSRAIRIAMAKYASRWRALDASTKARITAEASLAQEGASAAFGSYGSEGIVAGIASAQFPNTGSCDTLPPLAPSGLGSVSAGLDAGASLTLTGAASSYTLERTSKGQYKTLFSTTTAGPNVPLGAYTISGTGGKDVGAFSATVTVASHLTLSSKAALATIDRAQPLTVTWTGGAAGEYVLIGGGYTDFPHAYFVCAADAGTGTFTIPSYILSSVTPTSAAWGILWIAPNPLSNQITIPGIDLAYFTDGSTDSVSAAFQ